ncbi:MAG: ABC transporter ATP-binding protein [Myxococcales bacterium]|nr:ABC transporter ATP-binding protein [Myxococcales bacterium]
MIVAHGLGFSYGERSVFSDVSLALRPGELLALIGPNGAGKTTLIHVLSGLRRATSGAVWLQEESQRVDLASLDPASRARRLAVVEQAVVPAFDFTVAELVALGRFPHRHKSVDHDAVVKQSLSAVGVLALAERRFGQLSSGERQRVLLALALSQQPQVLLLDEPLAHLDPKHQVGLLSLIRRLSTEGLSILWSVHDLNMARQADRVALLAKGKLLACGPPSEVLTVKLLEQAYETPLSLVPTTDGSPPLIVFGHYV